mgnify:CR=1 FL=1
MSQEEQPVSKHMEGHEKLKHLSFELIDIGLYGGSKGLKYLKETSLYTATDKYVNYEEKFEVVKEKGLKIFNFMNDSVYTPLKENIIVVYDESSKYITLVIKLISEQIFENQAKIVEYVK